MDRRCEKCGKVIVKKNGESSPNFLRRKSCGRACHVDYSKHFHTMYVRSGPDECWEWLKCRSGYGYGMFRMRAEKRVVYAHRYAWVLATGLEPGRLWVLHDCDNPGCVNPDHLFLGNRKTNIADMAKKGRRAGQKHALHKLTWKTVDHIRSLASPDTEALARLYGVSRSAIQQVLRGVRWTNRSAWKEGMS